MARNGNSNERPFGLSDILITILGLIVLVVNVADMVVKFHG